jgi:hypothetical protein
MKNPEIFHPNFESVIARPPIEAGTEKETLPFDRFVEETTFGLLASSPFVEAAERALPEEDSAGADYFLKLQGLENPLAIDVTVSSNPREIKEKLKRLGENYLSKIDRPDAKVIARDRFYPIKIMPLFLEKKDFADCYNSYAASFSEGTFHLPEETQRRVFQEFLEAVRRLCNELYAGKPATAQRKYQELLNSWFTISGRAQQ